MLNGDCGQRGDVVSLFFMRIAKHFANEMAVVTPNGQLLSHDLDEGLRRWGEIPKTERQRPDTIGRYNLDLDPQPPEGGLILKAYSRALEPDKSGQLQIYKTDVARSKEPGLDHVWLTRSEWSSLIPKEANDGETIAVPDFLLDRICRRNLIDLVRVGGNGGSRRREEVLAAEARLIIEDVSEQQIRLRLEGTTQLATHDGGSGAKSGKPKIDEFALLGLLMFDRQRESFVKFDLLAFSRTGHYDEIHEKTLPLAVAFELVRGETPADRQPPSSFGVDYFKHGESANAK